MKSWLKGAIAGCMVAVLYIACSYLERISVAYFIAHSLAYILQYLLTPICLLLNYGCRVILYPLIFLIFAVYGSVIWIVIEGLFKNKGFFLAIHHKKEAGLQQENIHEQKRIYRIASLIAGLIMFMVLLGVIFFAGIKVYEGVAGSMHATQESPALQIEQQQDSSKNTLQQQQNALDGQGAASDTSASGGGTASGEVSQSQISGWKVYSDNQNGFSFQYPSSLQSTFASFQSSPVAIISSLGSSKIDANGCYVAYTAKGTTTGTPVNVGSLRFCLTVGSDVGAGQLYHEYDYTTLHGSNYVTLQYVVHEPNGCGAYEGTTNYQACMDFEASHQAVVDNVIRQSAGTLVFTK